MNSAYPSWLVPRLYSAWDAGDLAVLRATAIGEAEGESSLGQLAVCWVIRNRRDYARQSLAPWFCTSDLRSNALAPYQFSAWWASWSVRMQAMLRALSEPEAYPDAQTAALGAFDGTAQDPTLGADYYHDASIAPPAWSQYLVRTVQIGRLVFYTSAAA